MSIHTFVSGRFTVTTIEDAPEARQPVAPPAAPAIDPRSPEALKRLYVAFLRQKRERERTVRHLGRDVAAKAPAVAVGIIPPPAGTLFTGNAGVTADAPIVRPAARQAVPLDILQKLAAASAAFTAPDDD